MLAALSGCSTDPAPSAPQGAAASSLIADLAFWPFGAAEQPYPARPERLGRVLFLRGQVARGFPVPADWKPVLDGAGAGLDRLRVVNALVNGQTYAVVHDDRWRPPWEFLARGGDCDCFAVAKYVLLRSLGVAAADLRIVAVRRRAASDLHAILVARTGVGRFFAFVLDNASDEPRTALYTGEYLPLLSLNEHGAWVHDHGGWPLAPTFFQPDRSRP